MQGEHAGFVQTDHISIEDVSIRLAALLQWTEHESRKPTGEDVRIAAFAEAVHDEMLESRAFAIEIIDFIKLRHDIVTPAHMLNQLLRCYQADLIEHDATYPVPYTEPAVWRKAFNDIAADVDRSSQFFVSIRNSVSSNKADRYKGLGIAVGLLKPDIASQPLDILDVGCSQNHGLKQLAAADAYPFIPVKAGTLGGDEADPDNLEFEVDNEITSVLNRHVGKLLVKNWLGVDLYDINNPDHRRWAESCSYYPSEMLDPTRNHEFAVLENINVSNLHFFRDDFAHPVKPDAFAQQVPQKGYDAIFFSTMLYQATDEDRTIMRDRARQLVHPDGLIVYQDFADVTCDGDMRFLPEWSNWTYRTMVETPQSGEQVSEIIRWRNGRCLEAQLGSKALAALAR
ncbi:MAG: hypothetical protein NVS1B7_6690 [Candidatus Saccharimonadales bacterium]